MAVWATAVRILLCALPLVAHSMTAGANLMGSDLYNNLIRYFVNHLKTLRAVSFPACNPRPAPADLGASPAFGRAAG